MDYFASDGVSLMSVASLWLEFCMRVGRVWETNFNENLKNHENHDFQAALAPKTRFSSQGRCAAAQCLKFRGPAEPFKHCLQRREWRICC